MTNKELNDLFNVEGITIDKKFLYASLLTEAVLTTDTFKEASTNGIDRRVEMMMDFNDLLRGENIVGFSDFLKYVNNDEVFLSNIELNNIQNWLSGDGRD